MARILGFCGTAKNTGKTTAMKAVLSGAYATGARLALTSIGFDGEAADHVTGLPKPRIYAEAGTLLAIAEACMRGSSAGIEILRQTAMETAMGPVVIGRVSEPGQVLLAGPSKSSDVRQVCALLDKEGCDLILLDGALGRIAPMTVADGIIVSTGAARQQDMERLGRESAGLGLIFRLPLSKSSLQEGIRE